MDNWISVKDLKQHLAGRQISPEKFASEVGLSNMTIRRWLKKPDGAAIPSKYLSLLGPVFFAHFPDGSKSWTPADATDVLGSLDVTKMMKEIEKSGREYQDIETLGKDLDHKLKSARLDRVFADYCGRLFRSATSSKTSLRKRAIAIGALLYFISPIDLIPDYVPVFGYMDDLAVLCLAVNALTDSEEDILGQVERAAPLASRANPA